VRAGERDELAVGSGTGRVERARRAHERSREIGANGAECAGPAEVGADGIFDPNGLMGAYRPMLRDPLAGDRIDVRQIEGTACIAKRADDDVAAPERADSRLADDRRDERASLESARGDVDRITAA